MVEGGGADGLVEKIPKLNELQNGKEALFISLFRVFCLVLLHAKFSLRKYHSVNSHNVPRFGEKVTKYEVAAKTPACHHHLCLR